MPLRGIAGTVYNAGRRLEFSPPRDRIHNLDRLPFPLHDLEAAKRSRVCGVWDRPVEEQIVASVTYSRGCSGHCKFCSSNQVWGRQTIWRSAGNMVDEILELKAMGVNSLQFSDPTFNVSLKKVEELCNEMIKRDAIISWFGFCDPSLPNQTPEILELMHAAGCRKVGLGIEDPYIRSSVKKRSDNFEQVRRYVRTTHEAGIIVRAYLFIGHPEQYARNYLATSAFMRQEPVDEIRITIYTPLPGTESWNEMEVSGGLLTRDLRLFDTNHLVIKSRCTPKEAVEVRRELARSFYNSREYQERKILRISQGYSPQTYAFLEEHLRRGAFMD
ncbi:MAG TPA: radical SAM protein [Methanocorpusculum sp.]|nr:radical SAM protein [Methanocorpusculum sp.]